MDVFIEQATKTLLLFHDIHTGGKLFHLWILIGYCILKSFCLIGGFVNISCLQAIQSMTLCKTKAHLFFLCHRKRCAILFGFSRAKLTTVTVTMTFLK